MSGVNKVIVMGRLGADPELKSVGNGQSVARLSVATSESWTGKDGQKQERTEWHRIVVWGKQAENCARFLTKGRQVYVEGRLQSRSWEDPNGQKRYATEIVASQVQFIGGGERGEGRSQDSSSGGFDDMGPEPSFDPAADDIPF